MFSLPNAYDDIIAESHTISETSTTTSETWGANIYRAGKGSSSIKNWISIRVKLQEKVSLYYSYYHTYINEWLCVPSFTPKSHLSNQMFCRRHAGRQIFQGIEHLPVIDGLIYNNLFQLFQTVFILNDIQGWCILPSNNLTEPLHWGSVRWLGVVCWQCIVTFAVLSVFVFFFLLTFIYITN